LTVKNGEVHAAGVVLRDVGDERRVVFAVDFDVVNDSTY